jgi:hypothetical protein
MVHVPAMFLSEWRDFPLRLALKEKELDSARFHVVESARIA